MYTTLIAALPGEPYLAAALESVYAQTVPPEKVEVITDAGIAVPHSWQSELVDLFPGVRFRAQPGRGMAGALNAGIQSVATPYVAFLDCDDLWRPRKQALQLQLLQEDSDLHAVGCLTVTSLVGDQGPYTGSRMTDSSRPLPGFVFTATTFRTGTFARFGSVDPSAGHFVWLYRWWSQARRGGIRTASIDYVGLERRIHGKNSWALGNAQAHADLLDELRGLIAKRAASK